MLLSCKDPAPLLDEHGAVLEGSISEKVRVEINGVQQGMVIRGEDVSRPVLLVVHGGPGMPDYFLTRDYPTDIEDLFTLVWWEQRGTALSYHPDIPAASMTVEQFIAVTLAVTDHPSLSVWMFARSVRAREPGAFVLYRETRTGGA